MPTVIRSRTYIPSPGVNALGNPKQGKTTVVAIVTATAASGGFSVTPTDFGLTAIDAVACNLNSVNGGGLTAVSGANYDAVNSKIITWNNGSQLTTGTVVVTVIASGDSANDVESLP